MTRQAKQLLLLVFVFALGIFTGTDMGKVEYRDVVKEVEVVKNVPVEKIVETESRQCLVAKHNLEVAAEVINVKGAAIDICADLLMSYDYYLYNPAVLADRAAEIEALNQRLISLEAQYE